MEGREPVIWIIDNEHWPRAYLRAELIERGYQAISFSDLSRALAELDCLAPRPDAVILELRDQEITSEALGTLARAKVPVIGIGGTVELDNSAIADFPWADLLRRPVSIGAVVDAVERRIAKGRGHESR